MWNIFLLRNNEPPVFPPPISNSRKRTPIIQIHSSRTQASIFEWTFVHSKIEACQRQETTGGRWATKLALWLAGYQTALLLGQLRSPSESGGADDGEEN